MCAILATETCSYGKIGRVRVGFIRARIFLDSFAGNEFLSKWATALENCFFSISEKVVARVSLDAIYLEKEEFPGNFFSKTVA